jgi:hypothetical protein
VKTLVHRVLPPRPWWLAVAVAIAAAALACGGDDDGGDVVAGDDAAAGIDAGPDADAAPSGRACESGAGEADPTLIASPALECPSRQCLHVEGDPLDLCTARCGDASDCAASPESACDGDFVCTVPVDLGPFACQSLCVCATAIPGAGFAVSCP